MYMTALPGSIPREQFGVPSTLESLQDQKSWLEFLQNPIFEK